jgi:hypothetical protein
MPLSPNGLVNEIINSIKGRINNQNAANQFMPELGHAITCYLTKNTSVLYSWSGIQPGTPPVPDPVTHGIILGKQITDGIRTFKIMPASGWVVPPG